MSQTGALVYNKTSSTSRLPQNSSKACSTTAKGDANLQGFRVTDPLDFSNPGTPQVSLSESSLVLIDLSVEIQDMLTSLMLDSLQYPI